ncbi:MAG: NADH-quinone oxidoreductase subunit NuoG [Anaerolineaceae bacterium]|nr:MAG: NADH-quinone oxidoreductase subunit NuoG [Anaerolineaceae bacterium]
MTKSLVALTIDGLEVTVPEGTLIVDAAKKVGIDIPVFCYHPKLHSVGMCRVCLVEIGRPARDRSTGEPILDENGQQVINFGPNLETSCTTPVGEGWVIRVNSEKAIEGRKQIIEYLLTSHPLDCPICDKGGECPLQNQTMEHGPGTSRYLFDEKIQLEKHVPLGELIYLDRERCIQCSRCVRYQEEVVDDPVLGFTNRGRRLEIITSSVPGFNSYFSGNTTDICPVGALTTADFRFGARPWELNKSASICPHCPVGCNLTLNTRREAQAEGREVIKRVMPRQNERVNEIWICDKGRFAHHFASSEERLTKPMVRVNNELVEVGWDEALERAADGLKDALKRSRGGLVGIAGGRASNEDLFLFQRLITELDGQTVLEDDLAGGDLTAEFGVGRGTDLGELGSGDVVLVIACDLHEEAPIWWLRLKQATERGAQLIVANARPTRLEGYTDHILRYPYKRAVHTALGLLQAVSKNDDLTPFKGDKDLQKAARLFKQAENAIIFYGGEGLAYEGSQALAQACASLLAVTGHVGRPNNGLIAVWTKANTQGAWDMGLRPNPSGHGKALEQASAAYMMGVDPVADDESLEGILREDTFLIVQELFMTPTAKMADVVFPSRSFIEREGTFTSGERRVQRFYPAVLPLGDTKSDWRIVISLANAMGVEMDYPSAAAVMLEIAENIPGYEGLSYQVLTEVEPQWPHVGGRSLAFGGTASENTQGLGVQVGPTVMPDEPIEVVWTAPIEEPEEEGLLLVPINRLYDRGISVRSSKVLHPRLDVLHLELNPKDASHLGVGDGAQVEFRVDGRSVQLPARLMDSVPEGVALIPRSLGFQVVRPTSIQIKLVE